MRFTPVILLPNLIWISCAGSGRISADPWVSWNIHYAESASAERGRKAEQGNDLLEGNMHLMGVVTHEPDIDKSENSSV